MQILKPNTGNEIQPIYKNHVFAAITDYGLLLLLREIRVKFGNPKSSWIWIELKEGSLITVGSGVMEHPSFDNAINKMVNDPYCTVYDFDTYYGMIDYWNANEIKYQETIATVYRGKDNE